MTQTHKIADGQAVLYRRPRSSKWQVRIKTKYDGWYRTSTGEFDLSSAKEKALDIVFELRYKAKNNIPQISRKFRKVALLAIKQMHEAKALGKHKKVYDDYEIALKKYHIKILGKYDIDKIDITRIKKLERETIKIHNEDKQKHLQKQQLAKSTLNTHNSALMYVFNYAIGERWLTKSQIPALPNTGKKNIDVRPYFNDNEMYTILTEIKNWAFDKAELKGKKQSTKQLRELLIYYVRMLFALGTRPGEELLNLKWNQIDWVTIDNDKYLRFKVNGKTGERLPIAQHDAIEHLFQLSKINPRTAKLSTVELIEKVNEYVFTLASGERPKSDALANNFETFLTKYNLLKDGSNNTRTLYSIRHSYATAHLIRGLPIHQLSVQMGNSVPMIEKHYSKLIPSMIAPEIAGFSSNVQQLPQRRMPAINYDEMTPDEIAGEYTNA